MSALTEPVLITLDPPYRLPPEATTFRFLGWAEVDDPMAPDIRFSINGRDTQVVVTEAPRRFQEFFPGRQALCFYAEVDMPALLRDGDPLPEPFLLHAAVTSDQRERAFEYAVEDAWLQAVYGRPVRARPIPPEHLQIRVTGAAAGAFHGAGRKVADQISDILDQHGVPLRSHARILDFGSGPGRVTSSIADLHPTAKLFGSDIDAEAIGWARTHLGDIADFRVNGSQPPLPFPDESFDLIYSISIFTHLPEEMQWGMLFELRRMLKPGGVLLTTKLNPAAYDLPDAVKQRGIQHGYAYWDAADETEGLPEFYRLAYHTRDYVEREWGRYFEVMHVGAHDLNNTQDAVLMRRPRHALSWLPSKIRKRLHALKP